MTENKEFHQFPSDEINYNAAPATNTGNTITRILGRLAAVDDTDSRPQTISDYIYPGL